MLNTWTRRFAVLLAGWLMALALPSDAFCQPHAYGPTDRLPGNSHHLVHANSPPGTVAAAQAYGNRAGVGTFTAVSLVGPAGLKIALAQDGQFLQPIDAPVTTGMLVGAVYRFRVTNVPDWHGEELYPTLEIIDRVYPEAGREHRFPIPIHLTQDDLHQALQGALVTRVIYLEDSETAAPIASEVGSQMTLEVNATTNALRTADELGRPLAILRIGSRVPTDLTGDLREFLFHCPPWIPLPVAPNRDELIRTGSIPETVLPERTEAIYHESIASEFPREPSAEARPALISSHLSYSATPCESGSCGSATCETSGACAYGCPQPCVNPYHRKLDPNEHLFDGGDRDPRTVVNKNWNAVGINPSDTVVYYETAGGKVCVHPSNRVAIYAPRFGAVRQLLGAVVSASALSTGRVHSPLGPELVAENMRIGGLSLNAGPITRQQIQQLDGFREELRPTPVDRVQHPTPLSDAVSALINVDVSTAGIAAIREMPAEKNLTYFVQTRYLPESVAVMIGDQPAVAVGGIQQLEGVHVYEIPDRCSLRITKSASHTIAHPGDVIRFTIRFENVGPNKVGNVVIVDSLSSRLEYIGGSQHASVDTRFHRTPNEVGSHELRWEIVPSIDKQESGVISFDCRVR